ncbi:Coq4 family protein [Marinomonas transparens]|uniref:Coenzyme Q (Ubiquinone) biosynthesis protein Coq4 n=1 Tax=Marinomonas transparens TaxID=2795388 RepID=A0A934JPU5_9GAMM|nr:Coq4 family protein [Marinomonas transparens]MBJ7539716.1 hypothetical protein [Marinomonas transparens]
MSDAISAIPNRIFAYIKRTIAFFKLYKFIFRETSDFSNALGNFILPHTYPKCRKTFIDWLRQDDRMADTIRSKKNIDIDIEALKKLPENTLGHHLYNILKDNEDSVDQIQSLKSNSDYSYSVKRIVLTHDIYHALLNADTLYVGEIKVAAFTTAQIEHYYPSTISICTGILSACFTKQHYLHSIFEALIEGFYLGKSTKQLFIIDWEKYWDKDIEEVRKELNIDLNAAKEVMCSKFNYKG